MKLEIPYPLSVEYTSLYRGLYRVTKVPGEIGEAAKAVEKLMWPYFFRAKSYVLPPQGILYRLAQGEVSQDMEEVVEMTAGVKEDLDQLLQQHELIIAALENLIAVSKQAEKTAYSDFADSLLLYVLTVEKVSYPTSILIGEYLKVKLGIT
jgi:hypothetical protein